MEVLTALLDDDVPEVRTAAARALGETALFASGCRSGYPAPGSCLGCTARGGSRPPLSRPPGLLCLHRSLQDADRFAADMARHMLDLPDMAGPKAPV